MKCSAILCILVTINPAPKMLILCIALLKSENKQEQESTHSPALTEYVNPYIIISGILLRRLVYKNTMI